MEKITSFTQLVAWQEGHRLVLGIYKVTKDFPSEECFCLTSQIRRSVVSITSNIAEGFSRNTNKDKIQFYYIALGSVTEVQNQLLIARDLKYISNIRFKELSEISVRVHKLTNGLIKHLRNNA